MRGSPVLRRRILEAQTSFAWTRLDFKGLIKSERLGPNDSFFHFSLLPAPYVGRLETADVFILLLNPGFSPGDYFGEYERRDFRNALVQNLKQDLSDAEYPFLFLNPRFCWHPGYQWWEAKLRKILLEVADAKHKGNYLLALKEASQCLASIELVPYHSRKFRDGQLADRLKSVQKARAWVNNDVVQRAAKGELVIVPTHKWNLRNRSNRVVCVKKGAALGFHITPNTEAGRLVLKRLLKKR